MIFQSAWANRRRRRWSDNDRHFGPLTFAFRESWRPVAVKLCSGSTEHEDPGCNIRFQAFGCTMICELPPIIRPWRQWVKLSYPDANTEGYWDEHPREYGFSLNEGHFRLSLGAQTHDSDTTQDWGCFLPWTEWRVVREKVFNADMTLAGEVRGGRNWDQLRALQDAATKAHFAMIDYDGERIEVETFATEWERRLGVGWFKWLGFVVPKEVRRSLDIRFKSEVGPEKGSWKGGTLGHSIEMLPLESQELAFRRYCQQDHRSKSRNFRITFVDDRGA